MSAVGGIEQLPPAMGIEAAESVTSSRSPREQVWIRFKRDKAALLSTGIVLLMLLIALIGPPILESWLGRSAENVNPNAQLFEKGLPLPPNTWAVKADAATRYRVLAPAEQLTLCNGPERPKGVCLYYPLGTDGAVGHDELMWLVKGARTSLEVAFGATLFSMLIGVVLGAMAGFLGGWFDGLISRIIEIIMSFPSTLFIIALAAAAPPELRSFTLFGLLPRGAMLVMGVIALFGWYYPARVVRGQVLSLKEKEFVEAARMLGAKPRRIIFSHLLPYLVAPIIVYSTLVIGQNVLVEAGLSFLGVGIDAGAPSWGNLLETSVDFLNAAPLVMILPGGCLLVLSLALNLLGDGLRDAFDPRSTL